MPFDSFLVSSRRSYRFTFPIVSFVSNKNTEYRSVSYYYYCISKKESQLNNNHQEDNKKQDGWLLFLFIAHIVFIACVRTWFPLHGQWYFDFVAISIAIASIT